MSRQKLLSLLPLTAALMLVGTALVGRHWVPRGYTDLPLERGHETVGSVPRQTVTALPALPGTIVELRYNPAGRAVTLRLDPQEIVSLWHELPSWSGLRLVEVNRSETHWTVSADLWPVGTRVLQAFHRGNHEAGGSRNLVNAFLPLASSSTPSPGPAMQPQPPEPPQPAGRTGVVRFSGGHPMLWRWNESVLSLEAP